MKSKVLLILFSMSLLALVVSCGAGAYHKGRYLLDKGMYDDAVKQFQRAQEANPHNVKYKTALVRAKLTAAQQHFDKGKMAMAHGDLTHAAMELEKTLQLDPGNQYARDTLQKVIDTASEKEQAQRDAAKMSLEQMKRQAEKDTGVPQLDPKSNIPIVLKFKDTPLKTILDAVSKASGINFLYDDKVDQNKRVTVDFAKVDLAQVLDYLMLQTKNFYKVLDPHSLIIVPDTKQKRDEYQDEVIRTFYLSNANAKDIFQLVRSILQVRKMAMNQELNSITIEDTPENVAIAQRIIENNDKSKGEVLVDVEILEVDSNLTRDLGINLLSNKGTFTIGPGHNITTSTTTDSGGTTTSTSTNIGFGGPVPINELGRTLGHDMWIWPVPNLIVNLLLQSGDTQVLAKPQLRVMEGQKAVVHIGQRIPVPTSNQYLGSTGTSTTYTPITSYTYQDVGVKIEVEPKVHHNREVTLKLKTEVSSVAGYVTQSDNSLSSPQPILGTRDAQTTIRLEDGETSLLAGLIQTDDKKNITGLPGISEIPILRRLFSYNHTDKTSTDVVMLITPHIIRMPNITEQNLEPLYVGTADKPSMGGSQPSPFASGPAVAPPPSAGSQSNEAEAGGSSDKSKEENNQSQANPQAGRLLVSPTSIQATVGQPVIVNLVLIGAKELKGMQMDLNFPNDVLDFQGANEGTFFRMGGGQASFSGQEAQPGVVGLNMARGDNSGASGSGLIARIRFVAKKAGNGRIEVSGAQATGVGGQPVTMPSAFATVTVNPAPTPKPGNGAKTGG